MLVSLKVASTLDGKIATGSGISKWISSQNSRQLVHRLRHEHQAILIGSETLIQDDPLLNTRGIYGGASPIKVILDGRGRMHRQAKCLRDDDSTTIWVVGTKAPEPDWEVTSKVVRIIAPSVRPEIPWLIPQLGSLGIESLLVEGGAKVHASFLKAKLVNKIYLFLAPRVLGNDGLSWCGSLGIESLADTLNFKISRTVQLNPDLLLELEPTEGLND
jgi:diaminohydroxyphosphoribosylaminopyrimidine deaminase/5-amino-6-(5-phosphoribosylamino)uracil reductase